MNKQGGRRSAHSGANGNKLINPDARKNGKKKLSEFKIVLSIKIL